MTDPEHKPIPALIAGTGHGVRVHLPALRAAGFDVVGLVGSDGKRTRRRADRCGVPGAFTDLDAAIVATGARAVTIASPPLSHGPLALTAISHGCHVVCEKPFARDADEGRRMLEAAQAAGIVHLVGNQMRALPERVVIARAIADGAIGEPRFVTMIQHAGLVNMGIQWPAWWSDPAAGGGWLGASGSHMVDQVHSWLGPFASLSAALPVVSARQNVAEDSFDVRFALANGVEGMLQQTSASWGPFVSMTRVTGTAGTLWVEDGDAWLADATGTRKLPIPEGLALPEMTPDPDPRKQFLHVELPPTIRLFEALRDRIQGKPAGAVRFATFADGLAAMEVLDAIRASAARGGALVAV